jgi:uncharacterized protein with von Willebrand factor type A (vWA) domain
MPTLTQLLGIKDPNEYYKPTVVVMTHTMEAEVIAFVEAFVIEKEALELKTEFNAFITHGQNLMVYLDKEFKEPKEDMQDLAERIHHAVKEHFLLDFEVRNWGHRHVDLILKIEQCRHNK